MLCTGWSCDALCLGVRHVPAHPEVPAMSRRRHPLCLPSVGARLLQLGQSLVGSQVSGGGIQTAQTWANAGVCSASCAHALGSVCPSVRPSVRPFVSRVIWVIGCHEREVHDCCLKSYGVFYFSNVLWDHIPDANCSGVK